MHQSGKSYIFALDGMGKKMPKVFIIFTVAGLALMGVPGFAGFISKWNLMSAAVDNENPLAVWGVVALLVSALFTAMYMLTISVRAFFPGKNFDDSKIKNLTDPNWMMILPLIFFVTVVIIFGIYSGPFVEAIRQVASVM